MPQFKPPSLYENKDYNKASQKMFIEVEVLGIRAVSTTGIFSYEAGLEVTGIDKSSGPTKGGDIMTITGKNFRHADYQGDYLKAGFTPFKVVIGDRICPLVAPPTETEIKCRIPAGWGTNHLVKLLQGTQEEKVGVGAKYQKYDQL